MENKYAEGAIAVLVFVFVVVPIAAAIWRGLTGGCDPYNGCF